MAIKVVLFDIGGVVVDSDLEHYSVRAAQIFGTTEDALRQQVSLYVRDLERGKISSMDFWFAVQKGLMDAGAGKAAPPTDYNHLWRSLLVDTLKINQGLRRLCQHLAARGVMVGALSNTIEEHVEVFEEQGVYIPFNPLLLSCRLGLRKPEEGIFKLATKMAGVYPQEVLFVDDVEDNLPPARFVGMQTHLFQGLDGLIARLQKLRVVGDLPWHTPTPPHTDNAALASAT